MDRMTGLCLHRKIRWSLVLICDQANSLLHLGWKNVLAYGGSQRRKAWRWLWRNGYILAPCSDHLRCTVRILHLACATESWWCHSIVPNDPSPVHTTLAFDSTVCRRRGSGCPHGLFINMVLCPNARLPNLMVLLCTNIGLVKRLKKRCTRQSLGRAVAMVEYQLLTTQCSMTCAIIVVVGNV